LTPIDANNDPPESFSPVPVSGRLACLPERYGASQRSALAGTDPKIIAELDRVEGIVTGKRLEGRRSAVDAFRRAASSDKDAYEFYMACAKQIDFDQQGKSSTEFRIGRNVRRPT